MSQAALAARLHITKAGVANLERNELNEGITIGRLSEIARALDCQLVYALVPNTSLHDTVHKQAEYVAMQTLAYVDTTMGLEDQSVDASHRAEQLAEEARKVLGANRQWNSQ